MLFWRDADYVESTYKKVGSKDLEFEFWTKQKENLTDSLKGIFFRYLKFDRCKKDID